MVVREAPPGNLPLQPTSFIGRDEELIELTAAFSSLSGLLQAAHLRQL